MPLSGEQRAALQELKRRGSLSPEQVSAFDELERRGSLGAPPGFSKSREQLQHEHNLNVEAGKQADPVELDVMGYNTGLRPAEIASVPRNLGVFGGPAGAAIGEAAAQGIEMAGGARENLNPASIGFAAAVPAVMPAVAKLGGKAAGVLKDSAFRQYSKVIGATTKENKILSEKVVPELLDRRVTAMSRSGLEAKAENLATSADTALEAGYASLPQDAKVQMIPVLKQIDRAKAKLTVEGTDEVVRQDMYKALDKVQQQVLNIAGGSKKVSPLAPEVSVATARSARQQFDNAVKAKTKIFGKTGKETALLAAEKEAGNSYRAELAKEYPDIAELNKEFHLWQTVKDLVGETNLRTASQAKPLGERLFGVAGAAGGLAHGLSGGLAHGAGEAAIAGTALAVLHKLVTSTAWRTVSAVQKNRLADLLASGKFASFEAEGMKLLSGGRLIGQAALE